MSRLDRQDEARHVRQERRLNVAIALTVMNTLSLLGNYFLHVTGAVG